MMNRCTPHLCTLSDTWPHHILHVAHLVLKSLKRLLVSLSLLLPELLNLVFCSSVNCQDLALPCEALKAFALGNPCEIKLVKKLL